MKRVFGVVLAAAAALTPLAPARADDSAAGPARGEVTAVSLRSAPGRADFVVSVRGDVEVRDFLLTGPDRLVLDLKGARLGAGATLYDGVSRGGIRNVRYSQFQTDVVRIVLDLEQAKPYKIEREAGEIRVSFGADKAFLTWSSAVRAPVAIEDEEAPPAAAPVRAPARRPEVQTPSIRRGTVFGAAAAEEPRITVTWDRANVGDVVAGFASFSGRTIILGKDIKGEVTAEIKNQPWPQAFQAILSTQGLIAQEMPGGIIRVDNAAVLAALDSLEPLETSVVRVNYADAAQLARSVEGVLTAKRGRVVADSQSNALIVTDTKSRLGSVTDFIRGLDIRTPQLSIQAKIILVDRTDIEQLGVRYDLGSQNQFFNRLVQRTDPSTGDPFPQNVNVVNLGGNSISAIGNADAEIRQSALELVFSTAIGGFSLTTFLSALQSVELSDVQAEPLITTLDNHEAEILVGEEVPVRIIDAGSQGSGTARATVQFKETGIRLTVTPHVTNNRQIVMDLNTERSQITIKPELDLGFSIQKQESTNRLLVEDGETAVIGGLTVTEVQKTKSGIPLLSGLPVVGNLFSVTRDSERRRDLVILVTPRIVDDGAQ